MCFPADMPHFISISHFCPSQQGKTAVNCFLWEGQVVSRMAEVNLRLSGPEAD